MSFLLDENINMSSNNNISSNLVIDETDTSISSMNNNIASTILEVVITNTSTNAEGNKNISAALLQELMTKNSLLIELQNLLAIACNKAIEKKDTKVDEIADKMHSKLFSNST